MADTTKCRETLKVADDQGDGIATFTCELDSGHKGLHCEQYRPNDGYAILLWEKSTQDVKKVRP